MCKSIIASSICSLDIWGFLVRRRIHGIVCFGKRAANSPIFFFKEKNMSVNVFGWWIFFFGGRSIGWWSSFENDLRWWLRWRGAFLKDFSSTFIILSITSSSSTHREELKTLAKWFFHYISSLLASSSGGNVRCGWRWCAYIAAAASHTFKMTGFIFEQPFLATHVLMTDVIGINSGITVQSRLLKRFSVCWTIKVKFFRRRLKNSPKACFKI